MGNYLCKIMFKYQGKFPGNFQAGDVESVDCRYHNTIFWKWVLTAMWNGDFLVLFFFNVIYFPCRFHYGRKKIRSLDEVENKLIRFSFVNLMIQVINSVLT